MMESKDTFLFRLWFLVITLLIATNLILISFNLSTTEAIGINPEAAYSKLGKSHFGAMNSFVHGVRNDALSIVRLPGRVAAVASKPASLVGFIKPANTDNKPVPVIGENADSASDGTVNIEHSTRINSKPRWPIHGIITTYFGVPEMPYESVHTGLDISDGKPPGITPIKPFMPGVVLSAVHGGGLGNHVVIDHGGGLTSVYGHLYSISVRPGQRVNENTTIGNEGSTGVSTGTHLHFEIRIRGEPKNPLRFIKGNP